MSRVVIRTPFPTPEETARIMGVSKADLKWLRALAERVMPTGGTVPNGAASDRTPAANKKTHSGKRSPQKMTAAPCVSRRDAFLNVPYDGEFADLFLAYIAGLVGHGLTPRATLEVPGGARRLDRIVDLIRECRYSFHDLSRVELDTATPATPRFNMPFELGLAVACDGLTPSQHTWFVMESEPRRLLKSLSDLAGTDAYVHDGSPEGIFREIGNALVRTARQPTVQDLRIIHESLRTLVPEIN